MPRKKNPDIARLTAAAKRQRLWRSKETADQRRNRLDKQRIMKAQKLLTESSAERLQRLEKQRARISARRAAQKSKAESDKRLAEERGLRTASAQKSRAKRTQRLIRATAPSNDAIEVLRQNPFNLAFNYDPSVDYSEITDVDIARMNSICNNIQTQKWKTEVPGLCCSSNNTMYNTSSYSKVTMDDTVVKIEPTEAPENVDPLDATSAVKSEIDIEPAMSQWVELSVETPSIKLES